MALTGSTSKAGFDLQTEQTFGHSFLMMQEILECIDKSIYPPFLCFPFLLSPTVKQNEGATASVLQLMCLLPSALWGKNNKESAM
ncbi:hypothetical protein PVK06_044818 [Gossypium arboreum]|uniref:Uncharacterized protein n=1 Tax=Gossypium arboreum TaxID=29729 RepID=A0ABR0MST1_GOSAR|nr:hypothetical protein PVK06_044818 [Gossypium arboreum]